MESLDQERLLRVEDVSVWCAAIEVPPWVTGQSPPREKKSWKQAMKGATMKWDRAARRRRRDQQAERAHTKEPRTQAPAPHGKQAHTYKAGDVVPLVPVVE